MAPGTTRPGLRAGIQYASTAPLGYVSWGPIMPASGAQGGGVDFIVDDSDDDGDPFDRRGSDEEDDDSGDEYDDEQPRDRRRPQDRRDRRGDRRDTRRGQRDTPDDEDEETWEAPSREQWDRVQAALNKANREAGRRRYIGKQADKLGITDLSDFLLSRGIDPETGNPLGGDGHDEEGSGQDDGQQPDSGRPNGRSRAEIIAEHRRAEERGAARVEAQMRPGLVLYAAEAALREAGWAGKDMGLALRLINPEGVEVEYDDDSGMPVVFGLNEQIDRIKGEFGNWFRPAGGRLDSRRGADDESDGDDEFEAPPRRANGGRPRRTGGVRQVDGGDRGRQDARPLSWLERADRQLMRRGR